MSRRHPSPHRVKTHRSHTVEELAAVLGVHKNTVRRWIKDGLPTVDASRPTLLRGEDAIAFLKARRESTKRPCGPDRFYCFRCRTPQVPAGRMADLEVMSPSRGRLIGICPACSTLLYRWTNPARISAVAPNLDVSFRQVEARIADRSSPRLDGDLKGQTRA